jgi:hypothetical protein
LLEAVEEGGNHVLILRREPVEGNRKPVRYCVPSEAGKGEDMESFGAAYAQQPKPFKWRKREVKETQLRRLSYARTLDRLSLDAIPTRSKAAGTAAWSQPAKNR